MLKTSASKWLVIAGAALALFAFTPDSSLAVGDEPSQTRAQAQTEAETQAQAEGQLARPGSDLQRRILAGEGWAIRSRAGNIADGQDQTDPRVQTMIGFTLRKLGRVDEAMSYYQRVLAAHPDRTTTRQYLGEAFLQIGDPAKAREQLAEISKRCGVACEDYQLLADEIAKYEKAAG